eukprot:2802711-Rhodomonas_salina.6
MYGVRRHVWYSHRRFGTVPCPRYALSGTAIGARAQLCTRAVCGTEIAYAGGRICSRPLLCSYGSGSSLRAPYALSGTVIGASVLAYTFPMCFSVLAVGARVASYCVATRCATRRRHGCQVVPVLVWSYAQWLELSEAMLISTGQY